MGNGENEPIQFTRGDADRLTRLEDHTKKLSSSIGNFIVKIEKYIDSHEQDNEETKDEVDANTRFRKTFKTVALWLVSSSAGILLLKTIAESFGLIRWTI